jgi:hypothetical protein
MKMQSEESKTGYTAYAAGARYGDAICVTPYDECDYSKPIKFMLGPNREARRWTLQQSPAGAFFATFCKHVEGAKDGPAFVLGDMVPGQRLKTAVKALYGVGLDIDTGTPSAVVDAAIKKLGCMAVRYTTHSHNKSKTEFKRDRVMKFADGREIDSALMREFVVAVERWDLMIADGVEFVETSHTANGVMCVVTHPPMPKHRVVLLFAEPFVIANEAPTQAEAMRRWAKVPEALAGLLGVPFDTSCTDPSRLFYFPRHAKGAPFEISLFGGPYFDWRTLELDNPYERIASDLNKGKSKPVTEEGRALGGWHKKRGHGFQIADVIHAHAPDRIRRDTGHGLEIECPFDHDHSNAGDPEDRACLAVNAGKGQSEFFTISCRHESCRNKTMLDMLGKMIADGWFGADVLQDESYNAILEDDHGEDGAEATFTSASVANEIASFGTKPRADQFQKLLDKIATVPDEKARGLLFAEAEQNIKGKALKALVGATRTRANRANRIEKAEDSQILKEARAYAEGLTASESGGIAPTFANCLLLLERAHGDWGWAYDELAKQPVLRAKCLPWSDKIGCDVNDELYRVVRHFLIEQWNVTFKKEDVKEACLTLARYTPFNPVLEYLDGLTWDGVSRIDDWLATYLGVESTEYARGVGKVWLVAAVRRIKQPGCKFDNVLILEGKTRTGKSTAFKILGGKWFCDAPLGYVDSVDAAMKLRSRWVYELAELRDLKESTSESLKAFFSRDEDFYRAPYDLSPMAHPRRCLFGGSANLGTYLVDLTGNARYWPVKTGEIKLDLLRQDRDQLWAEAVALEASGFPIVLDSALWDDAAAEQDKRLSDDPWTDILRSELDHLPLGAWAYTTDLLTDVLKIEQAHQTATHMSRLRTVIEECIGGFEYGRDAKAGKRRGYKRIA